MSVASVALADVLGENCNGFCVGTVPIGEKQKGRKELSFGYSSNNSHFADGEREQAWRADVPGGEDAPPLHARPQSRHRQHGMND